MPPRWQVWLKDQTGVVVSVFDQWAELVCESSVSELGTWAMHLVGDGTDAHWAAIDWDYQVEARRADGTYGLPWTLCFEGFLINERRYTDADGKKHLVLSGKDYKDLLQRTIVDAAAGSAEAEKAGVAETVIKEFVDEQCGPGAGARARAGLAIQADGATGNAIEIARAKKTVLSVCQDIEAIGGGDFDVVGTGPATFEFRWYVGQRGSDRRLTVFFSEQLGNMVEPDLRIERSALANAVVVGGQGEEALRMVERRTDAASIALSPWGRCERFVDSRNADTVAGLQDRGDQELAENRVVPQFSFTVKQIPGCMLGVHYFLGDLVTARYNGVDYERQISRVRYAVTGGANPEETIEVETRGIV